MNEIKMRKVIERDKGKKTESFSVVNSFIKCIQY